MGKMLAAGKDTRKLQIGEDQLFCRQTHRRVAPGRRTAALATPLQHHNTPLQRRALPGSKKHHALAMAGNPCYYESLRAA